MLRRAARWTAVGVTVPAGAVAAGVGVCAAVDPGFRRQCSFWWSVGPGIASYRYAAWLHADMTDEEYAPILDKLHERWAPVALELILRQRGLFIKFGQVCSVRPELVPGPFRDAFRSLQSEVPGEPLDVVVGVIEAELGRPLAQLFERFDAVPVGSASIGQAHTARTLQGDEVCVKVQYPDARWQFMADIQCLHTLTEWTQPDALAAMDEFSSQYLAELDYEAERQQISACHAAVMPRFGDVVAVPLPLPALCTPQVLTMTYLDGPMLESEARRQLLLMGVDVDKGASVRDMLKKGADAVTATATGGGGDPPPQPRQGGGEGGTLLGSEASAPRMGGAVGQFLLRWVGLDVVMSVGGQLLRLRGALGLGAATLVEGAALLGCSLGVVSMEHCTGHWLLDWAVAARQR